MAGIVGQVISGFINQFLSWNYVFYLMGLFYFFTIFLVLVFLPTDNFTRVKISVIEAINKMASLFKVKALLLCFAVDLMLLMSMMCMYTALGYYLAGPQFGLSSQQILYVRAFGIFGIIFASISGFLVKKFELFPVLIAGLSISAISLMAMAIVSNVMLIVILSVIFVAGIAITAPALISIIAMIGGEARGSALSLHTVILFIGAGIGPVLAVTLLSTGLNYLPYLVMGIALFIGVIICLFIKQSIK